MRLGNFFHRSLNSDYLFAQAKRISFDYRLNHCQLHALQPNSTLSDCYRKLFYDTL